MKSLHTRITLLAAAIALVVAAPTGAGWNEGGGEQEEALTLTPNLENGMEVYERTIERYPELGERPAASAAA